MGEFKVATGGEVAVAIGDEQNQRKKRRAYEAGATEKTQQIVRGLDHGLNHGCTARTPNAMRRGPLAWADGKSQVTSACVRCRTVKVRLKSYRGRVKCRLRRFCVLRVALHQLHP